MDETTTLTGAVKQNEPLSLKIYRSASRLAAPIAKFALGRRLAAGKEDPDRIGERRGEASVERPAGELVWIHGASVGESLSILPLVKRLRALQPNLSFLVTTGTVTSAALMKERLPDGAIHQYVPLDHPPFVEKFLEHWRPDAAIFVESEFWPNLILKARDRIPHMALVNGRMSPSSFEDWRRQPNMIRFILSSFDKIYAQDDENAGRLTTLSGRAVTSVGNLKNAAPPLPGADDRLDQLNAALGDRRRWLAASTHPGEEDIVIRAHRMLAADYPDLLTIIAPRHPARGADVAAACEAAGLRCALRSKSDTIDPSTDIYIADTLGELGVFYRLCDIAFVGGAINPKGGHNPLEPARLSSAIIHGPNTFNFEQIYAEMRAAGGAALVRNENEMAMAVRRLFRDEKTRMAMVAAAQACAEENAEKILIEICAALEDLLPAGQRA